MATVALPSGYTFKSMKPVLRHSSKIAMSPINFTQQTYNWNSNILVVEFVLPILSQSEASDWLDFALALDGVTNTFNPDVSLAFPNYPNASSLPMRLVSPDFAWEVREATKTNVSFVAMEAK